MLPLRLAALFVAFRLPPLAAAAPPDPALPPSAATTTHTSVLPLGFEALAVEGEAGVDVREAGARLAHVVETVRGRLRAPARPQPTLRAIADAVGRVCTELVEEAGRGLFSGALTEGACDCDILTIAYLTVGEALGLPLYGVFLPGHALVQWDDGQTVLYWETTTAKPRPAAELQALVPPDAERAYLQPQSRTEMLGYIYQIRANYRAAQGDADGAEADYAHAERLNPVLLLTFYNRGRARLLRGDAAAALVDFDRALALDPTHADARFNRSLALIEAGRPREALADLDHLARQTGASADLAHVRGLAYVALGDDPAARAAFDAALAADARYLLTYEARAALHRRAGRDEAAAQDYEAFLRMAPGTAYEATAARVREWLRTRRAASPPG